jgi:hypothetical protein
MSGERGEDDLQVEAVFKREGVRSGTADFAIVDEDQHTVRIVFELGDGGQQVGP